MRYLWAMALYFLMFDGVQEIALMCSDDGLFQ